MERHDRERRKEEERMMREKQKEEVRFQREQRRALERKEKYLQKETQRVSFSTIETFEFPFCKVNYMFHFGMSSGREDEAERRTAKREGGCKA